MNIIWLESSCRWGPQWSRYRHQSGTSLEWWWKSAWQSTNSTWPRCFTSATVSRGKNGGGCWGVVLRYGFIWFLYGCFYADIQSFILSCTELLATEKQQKRLEHVQQTTTATPSVATIVKLAVGTWYRPKYYTYMYIYIYILKIIDPQLMAHDQLGGSKLISFLKILNQTNRPIDPLHNVSSARQDGDVSTESESIPAVPAE